MNNLELVITNTKPKKLFPEVYKKEKSTLVAGRYGTLDMVNIWGAEKTTEYSLKVQATAINVLSELNPEIVPLEHAKEINDAIKKVKHERVSELEDKYHHDIIGLNKALEEQISQGAGSHINKFRTSADTTNTAKPLQIKESLEIVADSVENLRDITLEKSMLWKDIPFMETSHLYDALPSVAGRAFSHYAEMLQSDLKMLNFVYENSLVGKWADATGNHHSADSAKVNGIKLQENYVNKLGLKHMDAPAQVPGLEFEADVFFVMARIGETINNMAKYVANGRSDDVNVFINKNPRKNKGSSAMPHKDSKNGNPSTEEQVMSIRNYLHGLMATSLSNCELPYSRNLSASANARINFDNGFKFLDQGIRKLSEVIYWLGINEERSKERVLRSYGAVTSQRIMTYLTDGRFVENPMTRSQAHDLTAELATKAWEEKTQFYEILKNNQEITSRINDDALKKLSDPLQYIGQSKQIIEKVYDNFHKLKTIEK